jgi:hypothetical protein
VMEESTIQVTSAVPVRDAACNHLPAEVDQQTSLAETCQVSMTLDLSTRWCDEPPITTSQLEHLLSTKAKHSMEYSLEDQGIHYLHE